MDYFEANLSVPLKYAMSDLISCVRCDIWSPELFNVSVGEGGVFDDRSRIIGACGLSSRRLFGIGC